jgi:hypothetical protein
MDMWEREERLSAVRCLAEAWANRRKDRKASAPALDAAVHFDCIEMLHFAREVLTLSRDAHEASQSLLTLTHKLIERIDG